MSGINDYSSFNNKLSFSNASNLGDISKLVNSGKYGTIDSSGPYFDPSQFNPNLPGADINATDPTWWQNFAGYADKKTGTVYNGWGGTAAGLAQAGLGFYLGNKQLNTAEDELSESRRQFDTNYAAQKALVNEQLQWQHKNRLGSNPNYTGTLTQIA